MYVQTFLFIFCKTNTFSICKTIFYNTRNTTNYSRSFSFILFYSNCCSCGYLLCFCCVCLRLYIYCFSCTKRYINRHTFIFCVYNVTVEAVCCVVSLYIVIADMTCYIETILGSLS